MLWFAINVPTIKRSSMKVSIFELSSFFVSDVWRSRFGIIIASLPVLDFVKGKRLFFVSILDGFFFEGLLDSSYDFFLVTTTRSSFFFFWRRRRAVNLLLVSFVHTSKSFPLSIASICPEIIWRRSWFGLLGLGSDSMIDVGILSNLINGLEMLSVKRKRVLCRNLPCPFWQLPFWNQF